MGRIKKILILMLILIGFATISMAANVELNLVPSKEKVEVGSEFTVAIQVKDFTRAGTQKAIEARLEYDTDILEYKGYKEKNDDWIVIISDDHTGFIASTGSEVSNPETIVVLTFKVKKDAILGYTEIAAKEIITSADGDEETSEPTNVKVEIIEKSTKDGDDSNPETDGGKDKNGADKAVDDEDKNANPENNKKDENDGSNASKDADESKSKNGYPKTGAEKIILPIILLGIISLIAFVRYRKYKVF